MTGSAAPRFVVPGGFWMVFVLVLAAGPMGSVSAQSLTGYVRDRETGETLIQATVAVEGTTRGAVTNTSGFYTLSGLDAGTYAIVCSYIGYEAARDTVTLAAGEARRLDFSLRPAGVESEEVVVSAEQSIEQERAVGVQDISIALVQRLPSVFEEDLFRSIQLLPGVKSSSDFSSKLYIRGGSPDQTLILLDGTTVYNPTHFFGFFSTFNTEAIKDVRLYKGAYPAIYGGRLGSVIDISNRDGNRNETAGSLSLGVLASRAGIEGPLNVGGARGSYMLAARRSTLEPLLAFLRNNLDEEAIPESFYFYDLNGKVSLDLSPNDRVSLAGYTGRDRVRVPFAEDAQFELDYGNRTLSLGYTRILGETVFATTRATVSRYESRPVGEIAGTTFERPNEITDYSGRADLEWIPGERFSGQLGVWGGYFKLGLRSSFDGTEQLNVSIPAAYGSAYAQGVWKPGSWILTGGLRADHFAAGNYTRFGPRFQVERRLGENVVAQFAGGRYYQFLTLVSSEVFSGFDTWTTTGEGVPPSESDQLVLGLKTRVGQFRFDTEVYGRTMRDLFDVRPELQDVAGLDYAELFRFGRGYAYGAEFLAEKTQGRLTGLLAYTYGVTRRRYPAEPDFNDYFAPKYDRLHDATLVLTYGLGRGWSLTGAGVYATGQAYTEPSGRYELEGVEFVAGDLNVLVTPGLNRRRLPPYHRLDLGLSKEGRFFSIGDYELQLQAVNVYNRRNLWFYTFDTSENPISRSAVRQLPILPNVSLTVRF